MKPVPTDSTIEPASRFWFWFGWGTHALFAVMVFYLFAFLKGVDDPPSTVSITALTIDVVVALQFAVVHSVLLQPQVRERLTQFVPSPAYGVMFCLATTASLAAMMVAWQPSGAAIWHFSGPAQAVFYGGYYASWILMFYSLAFSGYGYQTGWTTWYPWSRGRVVPVREFRPRNIYLLFRHPVYLSFLGLVWFTPCMTYDRVVLTTIWTAYIFYGSHLKDRRMLHYLGDRYRAYQSQVPGYPGIVVGPLGRIPWNVEPSTNSVAT
jgi:protein-S-isoprenylcysteine O-methyltransferase Ste14